VVIMAVATMVVVITRLITDLHITIMISIMEKEILIALLEELPIQVLQQQEEEQQVQLLQAQLVEIQLLILPLEDLQMI